MVSIAFLKSDLTKQGGLEKYSLELMQACAQKGFTVYILTTNWNENNTLPFPATVVSFGDRNLFSLLHLLVFDWHCRRWLKKNKVDYVFGLERHFVPQHFYRAGNGVHAAYLNRRSRLASFFKCFSFLINPLHKLILRSEKRTFESPTLIKLITNSHLVEHEVLVYYPKVDPAKIAVVHNGVEWKQLQKPFDDTFKDKNRILASLNIPPRRYQFLFVGNEYKRKGLHLLMRALAHISKFSKDWNLLVVGRERHEAGFYHRRDELGLQDNVFFFGKRSDVVEFYKASDCLVVSSLYDPFANVTIEALAMGLYVVSSDQNGGSEVIHKRSGCVYATQEGLIKSLQLALRHPKTPESASAIRNMYSSFDFSNQIQKIVNLITH